jgi:hypothetical protein
LRGKIGGLRRFRRQAFLPSPAPALGLRADAIVFSLYQQKALDTRTVPDALMTGRKLGSNRLNFNPTIE